MSQRTSCLCGKALHVDDSGTCVWCGRGRIRATRYDAPLIAPSACRGDPSSDSPEAIGFPSPAMPATLPIRPFCEWLEDMAAIHGRAELCRRLGWDQRKLRATLREQKRVGVGTVDFATTRLGRSGDLRAMYPAWTADAA